MTIRGPNGAVVTSLFVNGPTAFRDVFTLPATGTYTITVDPRVQQTGTLTFLLSPVADNTGTTAIGTPTTITTTTIGENAERTFTGTAGQKLTLQVSGNTFSERRRRHRPRTRQHAPSPVLFVADTDRVPRRVHPARPPATYTVVVDPRAQQTGTLDVLVVAGGRQHRHHRHRHADHRLDHHHRRERRAHLHRHRRPGLTLAVSANTFSAASTSPSADPATPPSPALFVVRHRPGSATCSPCR